MIAVSGAAMAVIRGREVGTVGWPGGDTVETLQETGGGQTVLLWDGGAIVALIRQFLHRGHGAGGQVTWTPVSSYHIGDQHKLYFLNYYSRASEHPNKVDTVLCCWALQQES